MDVTFTVTKQPGDNFRVLASCDLEFLKDAVNLDKDHKLDIYNAPAKQAVSWQSEVLTVWRRLHIERDSMAAVGNANTVTGTIKGADLNKPNPGQSTVFIDHTLDDDDQYEGGTLKTAGGVYEVVLNSNISAFAHPILFAQGVRAQVVIIGTPADVKDQPFVLHDDDKDDLLPLTKIDRSWLAWMEETDNADATRLPANIFATAYVRPTYDGGGDPSNDEEDVPVQLNVKGNVEAARSQIANFQGSKTRRGSLNSNDFWIATLQVSFQEDLQADFDPDLAAKLARGGSAEMGFIAVTPFFRTGLFGLFGPLKPFAGSLVFRESRRDIADIFSWPQDDVERWSAVHEVGHQFGCLHPEGPYSDPKEANSVMEGGWSWSKADKNRRFSEACLNKIRSIPKPGEIAIP
jgi:hypothetical protein